MDIRLNRDSEFRISINQGDNFIDIFGMEDEQGIAITSDPSFHYTEIRKKEGYICVFYFQNKYIANEIDLKWWADSEIIFRIDKASE